jgi:hypothetical protein
LPIPVGMDINARDTTAEFADEIVRSANSLKAALAAAEGVLGVKDKRRAERAICELPYICFDFRDDD